MNSILQTIDSTGLNGGLGFCIFGCKAQKKADKAKAAAVAADKVQAASITAMKENNALTAQQNAELIAQKDAETKKKTMIIIGAGAGILLLIGVVYMIKK